MKKTKLTVLLFIVSTPSLISENLRRNTIAKDNITINKDKIVHVGNSGTVGVDDNVGFGKAPNSIIDLS